MQVGFTDLGDFTKHQNNVLFGALIFSELAYIIGSVLAIPNGALDYPISVIIASAFIGFVLLALTVLSNYIFKSEMVKQWAYWTIALLTYFTANVFYFRALGTVSSFVWFTTFVAILMAQNKKMIIGFGVASFLYYAVTYFVFQDIHFIVIGSGYYYNRFIAIISIVVIAIMGMRVYERYQQTIVHQFDELTTKNRELKHLNVALKDTKDVLKDQYEKVYNLAYFDNLTGLGNRSAFNDYLSKYENEGFGIILIDIINMKFINDTYTHKVGDSVIRATGKRLEKFFENRAFAARLSGDEFAVVLTKYNQLDILAEQLIILFSEFVVLEDIEVLVNINIAILDNFNGLMTKEVALKNADLAMTHAKEKGLKRSNYTMYRPSMSEVAHEQFFISVELSKAIENREIDVVFQPKYSAKNQKIIGFEALARWNHETMGFVRPDVFIQIAEKHGMIENLTDIILSKSCKLANKINNYKSDNAKNPYIVTVNISGIQLINENFYQLIIGTLFAEEVKPEYIGIEITETAVMESLESALVNLTKIRNSGIHISLDDFGTGYSSLNYLRKLPIDTLKIDKSFVDHICHNNIDEYMTKTIIEMAQKMSIRTVAEGVEDEDQYNLLKRLGCDGIQGYYFSKPVKFNDAILLVKTE